MRRSLRDVAADRQRSMFGVDGLERQLADVTSVVLRLAAAAGGAVTDNVHYARAAEWLLKYEETQTAEWNGVGDGTQTK